MSTEVKTAYTAGPWDVEGDSVWATDRDADRIKICDIASMCWSDEIAPNINLIAAAPDLLEALKNIRECTPAISRWPASEWAMVDAAIAKAEAAQ